MSDNRKRNWQRLMNDRADQMVEVCMMPFIGDTTETLQKRIREAYIQGYRDGRESAKNAAAKT